MTGIVVGGIFAGIGYASGTKRSAATFQAVGGGGLVGGIGLTAIGLVLMAASRTHFELQKPDGSKIGSLSNRKQWSVEREGVTWRF